MVDPLRALGAVCVQVPEGMACGSMLGPARHVGPGLGVELPHGPPTLKSGSVEAFGLSGPSSLPVSKPLSGDSGFQAPFWAQTLTGVPALFPPCSALNRCHSSLTLLPG